jgi:hypothetical protein
MDKFIKENKVTATIIIILLIAIGAYYYSKQSVKKVDDLTLQTKCSDAAGKFFANKGYKINDGFDYKNHFNSKLNKCFILISSYNANSDFLSVDLYDAIEGNHYAMYIGHNSCDPAALVVYNDPKKCQLDSGSIWTNGDDTKNPADYHVGFQGYAIGPGVGDQNTQKEFMDHVQLFMNGPTI